MRKIKYRYEWFCIVLAIVSVFWGFFYGKYSGSIQFDIKLHTTVSQFILGNEFGIKNRYPHVLAYPLYHVVQKLLVLTTGISYDMAAATVICICNILSVILYRRLVMQILKVQDSSFLIDFISIGSVIFMPVRSWLTDYTFYAVHTGANPIHNPTMLFVRPFAIWCILCFLRILEGADCGQIKRKDYIGFSVAALLSVFAKPSFAIVFFPAMGILCLYNWIKTKNHHFAFSMILSICPSVMALIWQMMYTKSHSSATEFFFAWGGFTGYGTLSILKTTVAFVPAAFLLVKKTNHWAYLLAWLAFAIGWLQFFTLSNGRSGDLAWGFMLAMQYLMLTSLALSVADATQRINKYRAAVGFLVFCYQVYVGAEYFRCVYVRENFYI